MTPRADQGSKQGQKIAGSRQCGQKEQLTIKNCPFCTPQCLAGLAEGGPMDEDCPNLCDHGRKHLDRVEFLRLVRIQVAKHRGYDANVAPLHLCGSIGSLFKVRSPSHGYTFVAKGVETLVPGS